MGFFKDFISGGANIIGGVFQRGKRKNKQAQQARDKRLRDSTHFDPAEARKQRSKDIEKGREFGKSILGDGLGRVDAGRSSEMKDVLARRKKGMEGMDPAEQEAFRSKMLKQMQGAEQRQGLQLGGQLGGARGAGAAAQMRSLQQAGMSKRADMETDLFLKNQQMKREGLGAYESSLKGAEASEIAKQQFNIGQAAKEKGIEMAAGMGFAQMGSAERSAVRSSNAAVTSASMQQNKKPGLLGNLFGGLF
tara:strand:+ start:10875 stop:11621 length:747 start_codon:yes stop_codon:yes gene_type:complete